MFAGGFVLYVFDEHVCLFLNLQVLRHTDGGKRIPLA